MFDLFVSRRRCAMPPSRCCAAFSLMSLPSARAPPSSEIRQMAMPSSLFTLFDFRFMLMSIIRSATLCVYAVHYFSRRMAMPKRVFTRKYIYERYAAGLPACAVCRHAAPRQACRCAAMDLLHDMPRHIRHEAVTMRPRHTRDVYTDAATQTRRFLAFIDAAAARLPFFTRTPLPIIFDAAAEPRQRDAALR
jgi:hypothetical protein